VISRHVYFPIYSNGLKDVAGYLGYRWSARNASGEQSLVWRQDWLENGNIAAKAELIRYNMEDCLALQQVTEFVELLSHGPPAADGLDNSPIEYTDSMIKHRRRKVFERQERVFPDYAIINRSSWYDYQQQKISARAKGSRKPKLSLGRSQKPQSNKIVDVVASLCPACRSKKLLAVRAFERQIIDLKFSGTSVRRWVVTYRPHRYRCEKCRHMFVPSGFPDAKTKFGRGLMSWCMYQTVVGGQNMQRVHEGLHRLFGLVLPYATLYRFKASVADYYADAEKEVLSALVAGSKLYIDETAVKLRAESGYVWCMTDGISVYYFYKSSREAAFLSDMLRDFKGVLISDFFTGYDSLSCAQQRCLIHLMRDFNEEMHKHPFDQEL
jgi:Transposase IS66 family/RNase_H superfamily